MSRRTHNILMTTLGVLLSCSTSNAALISSFDVVFGPGAITRDTDTGLDWLDLTKSTNRSFNNVAAEFGAGGDFEGWRHAVGAELNTLFFTSAGITPGIQSPPEAALVDLISLVGPTFTSASLVRSLGTFDDQDVSSLTGFAELNVDLLSPRSFEFILFNAIPKDFGTPSFGHWLVRPVPGSVPEPASVFVWLLGILAMVSVWTYRSKRKT